MSEKKVEKEKNLENKSVKPKDEVEASKENVITEMKKGDYSVHVPV